MRILLVTSSDDEVGGVSYVVGNLARYLTNRGHEVLFLFPGSAFFPRPKKTRLGLRGIEIRMQTALGERHPLVSIIAFLFCFPLCLYQLISLIRRNGIQVINVQYPTDCFFYLALCARILSLPLVTSVHGADLFPGGDRPDCYSSALRLLLNMSDSIIAPSRYFSELFGRTFPLLSWKATFIHNGVSLSEMKKIFYDSNAAHGLYVFCVSDYKPQKAIDVLIRAFAALRSAHPSARLLIAGDGPLKEFLEALARNLNIQDAVRFLGRQSHRQIISLLHGCKVFVLPSRFETFGIVILEAMGCQKPVIATTAGGIPEVVRNGVNGILVPPDDPDALTQAIHRVLSDENLQIQLATNGLKTVREQFDFEHTGQAYEKLFNDLLNGNKPPSKG